VYLTLASGTVERSETGRRAGASQVEGKSTSSGEGESASGGAGAENLRQCALGPEWRWGTHLAITCLVSIVKIVINDPDDAARYRPLGDQASSPIIYLSALNPLSIG
jgi:hypothetical protein